jgi:hypothetical protein
MDMFANDLECLSTKEAWIQEGMWADNIYDAYEMAKNSGSFVGFDLPIEDTEKEMFASLEAKGSETYFGYEPFVESFSDYIQSMGNDKDASNAASIVTTSILGVFLNATSNSYFSSIMSSAGDGIVLQNRGGDWHIDRSDEVAYRAVFNLKGPGTIYCKLSSEGDQLMEEIGTFVGGG